MKTSQSNYLDFLGTPKTQMAIPVFQRVYTWGTWQCDELWEDILKAGSSNESHFIGSIVYTDEEVSANDSVRGVLGLGFEEFEEAANTNNPTMKDAIGLAEFREMQKQCELAGVERLFNIVDGQQRTTTMTLLLIALRDYLRECPNATFDKTADDVERKYLFIENDGNRIQKFIAAPADKETLTAILNKTAMPEEYLISKCVVDNYAFFKRNIAEVDLNQMWRGLENLFAIIVELGDGDNPQLVFEGINSKGMSLATSDLLRNRMFFEQDPATQDRLLAQYWEPLEALFEDDPTQQHFNAALRYWLVSKDEAFMEYSTYELYSVFRKYIDEHYPADKTEELMIDLFASCDQFKHMIKSPPMKKHLDWAQGRTKIDNGSGFALFG